MILALYTAIRANLDAPRATASWPASWFGSRRVGEQTVTLLDAHGRRTTDSGVLVTLGGVTLPSVAGVATFPGDRYEADPALAGLPVTLRAGRCGGALGAHFIPILDPKEAERVPQAEYVPPPDMVNFPTDDGWYPGVGPYPATNRGRNFLAQHETMADLHMEWHSDPDRARAAELARRATREYAAPGPDLGGPAMPVPYGWLRESVSLEAIRIRLGHEGRDYPGRLDRAPVAAEIARLAEQEAEQASRDLFAFETLVFDGPLAGEMARYTTWTEAEQGHQAMVDRVKAALVTPSN